MNRSYLKLVASGALGLVLAAAVWVASAPAGGSQSKTAPPVALHAIENMGALALPARAADAALERRLAAEITALTAVPSGVPEAMAPGSAVPSSLRVLREGLGSADRAIYAFRTDRGRVCGGLTGAAAGCLDGFRAVAPVEYTIGVAPSGAITLFGFAPDTVRSVELVAANGRHVAHISRNTFFLELPQLSGGVASIEALRVVFKNGRTQAIDVAYGRR